MFPVLDSMLEDILALLPVLRGLTRPQTFEAQALRTIAFRALHGFDPVNPVGYLPTKIATEWPRIDHTPMDGQLASLLSDVMFTLPDFDDRRPEEEQVAGALYTICWKIVHGFNPPCSVGYVPKPMIALESRP